MGVIRGGLFVIASVLLFTAMLAGGTFLTFEKSLEYSIVQPELTSVLTELVNQNFNLDEELASNKELIELTCQNNTKYSFATEFIDTPLKIPCDQLTIDSTNITELMISNLVEENYNKQYDCKFFDCFDSVDSTDSVFFLVSAHARDYWKAKFYWIFSFSLILIAVMFVLIENRVNLPIVVGSLLIIAALPFAKLNLLAGFFADKELLAIFAVFITQSVSVFWYAFLTGIIVLALGIFLKFFQIGFWINNIFSKLPSFKKKD